MIYEESAWTNNPKDEQAHGRTDFGMNTARFELCIIAPRGML